MSEQVLDCLGIPEFYSDRLGALEDAGYGMMRVVRCVEHHGVLVPVFSFVLPAVAVLHDYTQYRDMAQRIAVGAMAVH